MYYISDIYNSMTQEHVKSLVTVSSGDEFYWVELRDCETDEQVVVCKPSIVFEDRYKNHVIGIVTAYTIRVINRSFLNLLSYVDVKYLKSSETRDIPKNAMIDIGLNVRNSNGLWYSPATPLHTVDKQKYLSLFEVLVKLQNQHQDLNIYEVGVKYLRTRLGGIIKVTVKKDLTLPITKYMVRK